MSDTSKLTVAKLKALCKEKGLTNYSKLSKQALLEKLRGIGVCLDGPKDTLVPTTNLKSSGGTEAKSNGKRTTDHINVVFPTESSHLTRLPATSLISTAQPRSGDLTLERTDLESHPQENPNTAGLPDFPAIPPDTVERLDLSSRSGYKRSVDVASPHTNIEIRSKAFKRLKTHVCFSDTMHQFKVPEVPRREVNVAFPTYGMRVCGKTSSDSAPDAQYNSYSSPATSKKPISHVSSSCSDQVDTTDHILRAGSLSLLDSDYTHKQHHYQNTQIEGSDSNAGSLQDHTASGDPVRTQTVSSVVLPHTSCTPSAPYHIQQSSGPYKSRFVPPRPTSSSQPSLPGETSAFSLPYQRAPVSSISPVPQSLEDVLNSLRNITIPPSISQRKRLPVISLALTGLDDAERATCVLVSKLFRYAIYVSARHILGCLFAGERLAHLFYCIESRGRTLDMCNLWPYLRLREQEVLRSKKEFEESWVPRFFRELGSNPAASMSKKLWTSPDSDEQFSVAFRFIQTRICFALAHRALGDAVFKWVTSTVIDARQVLENEIWSITVVSPEMGDTGRHLEEKFYVLYQTCEVIGHPPESISTALLGEKDYPRPRQTRMSHTHLRADWSSYITLRLPMATRHLHAPLIQNIRDTNQDDFDHGIARVWLKRMGTQGEEGNLKIRVAEKYIFGCVLGNCVSGKHRSTTQMAQEFASIPQAIETHRHHKDKPPKVNMVIPERHNVESVHFTKPGGLHPALAVVQLAGRQGGTLVLKENGLAIGEDEKLPEVWMKLLGCGETGVQDGRLLTY